MRIELTQPVPYPELEKELRGVTRMLASEGYCRITNLVISFDGEREGEPPWGSADWAGVDTIVVEGRLGPIRWPRPR